MARPLITIEVADRTETVRTTQLHGAERDRIYAEHAAEFTDFDQYRQRTDRVIPVIALDAVTREPT
jgi:hypothetical protein